MGAALITSSSLDTATGNAGQVTIQGLGGPGTAASVVELSNSDVQTRAASEQASGGAIRIQTQLLHLRDESAIQSDTEGQRGGDIDLEAELVVLNDSDVIANSEVAREKAEIHISGALISDPSSVVQASGGVSIIGSVFDLSSTVQLPLAFLEQAGLLPQRCAHRLRGGQVSSLAVVGRDGLPPEPGRMLLSDLMIEAPLPSQEIQSPKPQSLKMQDLLSVAWHVDCDK